MTESKLYFAETDPIAIERGTFQGDTLSPLLFLIFIEPLLRWLQSGGRGYKPECLSNTEHADYTNSSNAYADDLAVITLTVGNLDRQAKKIENLQEIYRMVRHDSELQKVCATCSIAQTSPQQWMRQCPVPRHD